MRMQSPFLRHFLIRIQKIRTGNKKLPRVLYTVLCLMLACALAVGSEQLYLTMTGTTSVQAATFMTGVSVTAEPEYEPSETNTAEMTAVKLPPSDGMIAQVVLENRIEQAELERQEAAELMEAQLADKAARTEKQVRLAEQREKEEAAAKAAAARAAAKAAKALKPLSAEQCSGRVLKQRKEISLSARELDSLERIVQSEAGSEDIMGKILVANVVLNRYRSEVFPNTIEGVVTQRKNSTYQFSPVRPGGGYWSAKPSGETKEAVKRALSGEDYSEGALYFVARRYAEKDNMSWFDRSLTRLFRHGNHEFYY